MLNAKLHQRGATLIELMVGVTLVAILIVAGLPSFSAFTQSRQIRTAAEAIQNGLQVARTEALRRNRVVRFQLRSGGAWTVGCDPADSTVVAGEQVCPEVLQTREAQEGSQSAVVGVSQIVQSSGAAAGSAVFTGDLRFTSLGRVASDTLPAGNIALYQITNPTGGTCTAAGGQMKCLNISVTASGQIRMCDPSVTAAGDSRRC